MPGKVDVKHAGRLAAHLLMQRELGKYCDVCICIGEKRFLAHKCVLSANSTKLDVLILDAIGQNNSSQDIEIEIQGVSPVGFETLLEHFYTGELNLEPLTVMAVWMTAAYLELPNVVALCNDYCQRSVTCVSNQTNSDISNKVPDTDNKNNGAVVVSSNNPQITNIASLHSPSSNDQTEVSSVKLRELTPVSSVQEPEIVDDSQAVDQKMIKTNEGQMTWSSGGSPSSPSQQNLQQYQSVPNTWQQTSQSWPVTTYTVAANNNLIKNDSNNILEDGEITIEPEPHLVAKVENHINYIPEALASDQTQPVSIIDVNKISDEKPVVTSMNIKPDCENMMMEVEALRIQHQQLQRLQQQKASLNGSSSIPIVPTHQPPQTTFTQLVPVTATTMEEPVKKKSKKKKQPGMKEMSTIKDDMFVETPASADCNPSQSSHVQANILHTSMASISDFPHVLKCPSNAPSDFRIITNEYRESLYQRYPIKPETPMRATCLAAELLQRGKSRKRKSTEQNALNNTIRLILDTIGITESSDPAVEDALILIMDRFESLRNDINDPVVRRSLLVKVRHSIHCKKWRVKRQMLKEKMDELGVTSPEEYSKIMNQQENEDSLHG
ncbi:uncharacterized protein LOC143465787 isoform X2 [Clavelina lepadiformis]|uniref:BTB domain-containing protein n=1 Tax=Clavelina lepadiformis TaxID=159417 RepID=A0ABP0EX09_CLALP